MLLFLSGRPDERIISSYLRDGVFVGNHVFMCASSRPNFAVKDEIAINLDKIRKGARCLGRNTHESSINSIQSNSPFDIQFVLP